MRLRRARNASIGFIVGVVLAIPFAVALPFCLAVWLWRETDDLKEAKP